MKQDFTPCSFVLAHPRFWWDGRRSVDENASIATSDLVKDGSDLGTRSRALAGTSAENKQRAGVSNRNHSGIPVVPELT